MTGGFQNRLWSVAFAVAVGVGVSYRLGGAGRPNNLNNIAGRGDDLYTPFPSADFPSLLGRKK